MFGRCRKCGRKLTDPISRERGFGPECWAEIASRAEAVTASVEDEPLPGQINLFDYMENAGKGMWSDDRAGEAVPVMREMVQRASRHIKEIQRNEDLSGLRIG